MRIFVLLACAVVTAALAEPLADRGALRCDSVPGARFKFSGFVGERVEANVDNWLLRAPQANPGILEMVRATGFFC